MSNAPNRELVLLVGWLDAMRRGDLDAVRECFEPDATWEGMRASATCHNRDEILDMLRDSQDWPVIEAIELVKGRGAVILGAKSPEFNEIGGVPLEHQVYNVFFLRDGRITSVQDFPARAEALEAAGADDPNWV
jgi:ketosteroid isomerase-like protein